MSISVAFLTLGCPKNEADTDAMRVLVAASAYSVSDSIDDADVVVLNTCSFIQEATEESIATTLELIEQWVPQKSGRKLIVTGCMPSRYGEELEHSLAEVDAFLPVLGEKNVLTLIEELTSEPFLVGTTTLPTTSTRTLEGFSAYIKISDGCDQTCTYCAIPAIRGPYKSRPLDDILCEVKDLVAQGARELIFIGQDTSIWGVDLGESSEAAGKPTLSTLLREASLLCENTWIRVMYLQPEGISNELLATIAELDNVCNYFDIPLQHASKRILRAMHRAGSYEKFLSLTKRIREKVPGAVLRTTIIAGFPGETKAEAAELIRFLEEAEFDYAGVFEYSQEEGTAAAELPDQVPSRTRRARTQRLRDIADRIGFARQAARIDDVYQVLIEEIDDEEDDIIYAGRFMGQAPEIDGQVHVSEGVLGEFVTVRITDSFCYELEGELLQ